MYTFLCPYIPAKKYSFCIRFEFVFANDKEIYKASNAGQRKVQSKTLSLYDFCIEVFTVNKGLCLNQSMTVDLIRSFL